MRRAKMLGRPGHGRKLEGEAAQIVSTLMAWDEHEDLSTIVASTEVPALDGEEKEPRRSGFYIYKSMSGDYLMSPTVSGISRSVLVKLTTALEGNATLATAFGKMFERGSEEHRIFDWVLKKHKK